MRIILHSNRVLYYIKQITSWMPSHKEASESGNILNAISICPRQFVGAHIFSKLNVLESNAVSTELPPGKAIHKQGQTFKEAGLSSGPCSSEKPVGFPLEAFPKECKCFPVRKKGGILPRGLETGHVHDMNPSLIELLRPCREEVVGWQCWRLEISNYLETASTAYPSLRTRQQICGESQPLRGDDKTNTLEQFTTQVYPPRNIQKIQCDLEETALRNQTASWLQNAHMELERQIQERTIKLLEGEKSLEKETELRRRAEEAHMQALRRLVDANENERSRLSRELHDQMSQELTALKLGLNSIQKEGTLSPPGQERLLQLEEMANVLMQKVHRLAWELRPPMLKGFGLGLALRDYVTTWSSHSGVQVDYYDGDPGAHGIPSDIELVLYRVAQEALTNVARHAHARHASVILQCREGCISLIVEDDGQGFDVHKVLGSSNGNRRLGILGMQERVGSIGGLINIESDPDAGTTVYVRIPSDNKSIISRKR
jgi:signal transduction histidine kinase